MAFLTIYGFILFFREWMDVISPPIVHPNQQMTGDKGDHSKASTRGKTLLKTFTFFT